jgi:hypothetical protein
MSHGYPKCTSQLEKDIRKIKDEIDDLYISRHKTNRSREETDKIIIDLYTKMEPLVTQQNRNRVTEFKENNRLEILERENKRLERENKRLERENKRLERERE